MPFGWAPASLKVGPYVACRLIERLRFIPLRRRLRDCILSMLSGAVSSRLRGLREARIICDIRAARAFSIGANRYRAICLDSMHMVCLGSRRHGSQFWAICSYYVLRCSRRLTAETESAPCIRGRGDPLPPKLSLTAPSPALRPRRAGLSIQP